MPASNSLPLEDITVIAVEQAVAAPFCSSRLADAGARVIKIERAEGDFARGYDDVVEGQSSYFVWLNRGKESLVLDLAKPDDKDKLRRLLQGADVLIQNLKPGALGRLGFSLRELRECYPQLILCSISGYSENGPHANRKAYDLLIQADSGVCSITGGPNEPARVGVSLVDVATGATAYSAILEALIRRGINGQGADIRVSLFDVMADWLTVPLLQHEGGKPPKRFGLAHPSIAPYGAFQTLDKQLILIAIQNDREWRVFCTKFMGNADLGTEERFATNVARVSNRKETDSMVAARFNVLESATAQELLLSANIAYAPVNDMAGLSKHPHLRRIEVDSPNGPISFPAPGTIFMGEERSYGSVPAIGEHKTLSDDEL